MKKLVILLLLIHLISIASAVEIKLTKEIYAPEETLQAEIYGNFIDGLELENIYFYRERNIPVIYDVLKLKDKYLLYALLPQKEGNYTLKIKDTKHETDTGVSTSDIIKEFQIQTTNETVLTLNPGFVIARDDFHIEVKANKNTDIEAEFEATGEKQALSLIQNREKKVYFSISEIKNYTETNIKIKDYNIPVFIFPEKSDIVIRETSRFRFNPLEIDAVIFKGESYFFKISLINFGKKNISNIKLSADIPDLEVEIAPSSISELGAGEREFINLIFSSEEKGDFSGNILAVSEDKNLSAELGVNIKLTENKSEVSYEGPSYIEEKGCEESGGKICGADERCTLPLELTQDGYCCKGDCIEEKKSSNWIYGIIIIVAVVAGLIFFSLYIKKKQKKSVDILKQREKKYEERMTGEEVRGKLSRT